MLNNLNFIFMTKLKHFAICLFALLFVVVPSNGQEQQNPDNLTFTETVNGVSFKMIGVEGGSFKMGGTSEQGSDVEGDEKPVHTVTLSTFQIGKYEVPQKLWVAVMGSNPSYRQGDDLPVEKVSWNDVQEFLRKLNQMTGRNYRLPTEAEWEYAARGGNKSQGYKYSGSNNIDDVAWHTSNSHANGTTKVGSFAPNELGIYDMSGNVWEWCQDWYGGYSEGNQSNPTGPASGSRRVYRGGGWKTLARHCRVSDRNNGNPYYGFDNIGFRLAL